ncbi:hypothetical protein OA88_18140 [Flavobacterium sp. JRM]|nr:hypothetical protein OA88_18140 [Flavobacterium sp. JRM]
MILKFNNMKKVKKLKKEIRQIEKRINSEINKNKSWNISAFEEELVYKKQALFRLQNIIIILE